MTANPTLSLRPRAHEIAIVGNDMMLAALPARPVQLAHAIMACGYDLVVPVSWGEELLATKALDATEAGSGIPRVFCACPRVRTRLLASGSELADHLLSFVAPPVATARYLRAVQPDAPMRITYLGGCDAAKDASIDARVAPRDFLRHLEVAGISLLQQSSVFDSVVPPDRRRHTSLPGGMPAPEFAAKRGAKYRPLALTHRDFAADIADKLIAEEAVLIDIAASLGCLCAGVLPGQEPATARDHVAALEPPRSPSPVIDADVEVGVDAPLPTEPPEPRLDVRVIAPPPEAASIDGVHSIEDARRRTERKRIAITPASIPATPAPQVRSTPVATQTTPSSTPPVSAAPVTPTSAVPAPPVATATRVETPSARKGDAMWRVVRTATPPRARAGDVSLPRAYAAHRKRPDDASAPELLEPVVPAATLPEVAPPVAAVLPPAPPTPVAPAPTEVPRKPYVEPSLTQPASFDAARPVLRIPSPTEVNEYVTVKQRMAQRKLHSWPRYVPPAQTASDRVLSERFWRLLAYLMLILAIAVATLAIVKR